MTHDVDEAGGLESEDEVVNPGPALEALAAAQQQLVIMQDLIKNVQTLHVLSVHYVDAPRSTLQSLTAAAVAVESRKRDLRSASERLRQAAKQMESETQQNNKFIECLSDLQVSLLTLVISRYVADQPCWMHRDGHFAYLPRHIVQFCLQISQRLQ